MQIAFDAMCDMLMSITDAALLKQIERDCTAVSNAMLSIPVMIPGTRYYKGIKVSLPLILNSMEHGENYFKASCMQFPMKSSAFKHPKPM